jgi:glycosyltransferase involved in cell wall biosynthesis
MLNHMPLVSIGIPTYNRPEGVKRTIEQLLQQTYKNFEILVSDNCSTIPEVAIALQTLADSDSRIHYVRQPENIGQFRNFQTVLNLAKGDYFTWAADDDERSPQFLENCLQAFSTSPHLLVVNSYSEIIHAKTEEFVKIDRGCTTLGLSPVNRYKRYISSIFTDQAANGDLIYGLMKRSALNQAFTPLDVLPWDHVVLARLALEGEFYTIPEPLMRSRTGGTSRSNKAVAKAMLLDGTPSQQHPWWTREKFLQQAIQDAVGLTPLEKVDLSLWSYGQYWINFGWKAAGKSLLPAAYKAYRAVRYGER